VERDREQLAAACLQPGLYSVISFRDLAKATTVAIIALAVSAPVGAALVLGGSQPAGFLPAGHWVPSQLPMTIIFPRPDSETRSYAREHWSYWDSTNPVQYRIPLEVQGGAYPDVYTLLSGPPGMYIQQPYWVPGDTAAQMLTAGYDELVWTPQGNISSPWSGTVSVLVTGQDGNSVTISFTLGTVGPYSSSSFSGTAMVNGTTTIALTVTGTPVSYGTVITGSADIPSGDYIVGQTSGSTGGTGNYTLAVAATGSTSESITGNLKAGFLFIDSTCGTGCDTTGSGTIGSPWYSLEKVYGNYSCVLNSGSCSTYPGGILYLRGKTGAPDYEAEDQTGGAGSNPGFTLSGKNNPIAVLGFPGDPVTPDIDITNITVAPRAHTNVFSEYDDASDLFLQGFNFSGTPAAPADGMLYVADGYSSSRATFENISAPNVWPGTSSGSANSTLLEFSNTGSPYTPRQYIVMKGVSETGRPGNYDGAGIFDAFTTEYAVTEFCTFQGTGGGGGAAYLTKDSINYWTNRYDFSSGQVFLMFQAGYEEPSTPNSNIEDAYNTIVYTGSAPAGPQEVFNQASVAYTTNTFSYRNSVVGAQGVSQSSVTGGPYWFSRNAVQYGTTLTQAIVFSTNGNTWAGGAFPSNVRDGTPTGINAVCQAASGIFNGSYQLTGVCAASYAGEVGAQIQ
jgi:hypothetical protein